MIAPTGRSARWSLLLPLLVLFPLVGALPASAEGPPAGATGGLGGVTSCFHDSGHLLVSLVVDESRSLRSTDPGGDRVDAALAALDGLVEIGQSVDDAVVEMAIGTFGEPYTPLLPFTVVESETEPEIRRIISGLGRRDAGTETDLVTALSDAHRDLGERASEVGAEEGSTPCSILLLFTDGAYNLMPRGRANSPIENEKFYAPGVDLGSKEGLREAEARGFDLLCREGGLVDSIRADEITMVGVMLEEVGAKGTDADADFLRAVALGTGGDRTCGRPDETIRGSFLSVDDSDLLIARFHEFATQLNGGFALDADPEIIVCEDGPCPEGSRSFEIDALTRRIRILALTPESEFGVRITGPGGDTVVSEAGAVSMGEVTGEAQEVAGRGLVVDLERPEGEADWAGPWSVSVEAPDGLDDTPGILQIHLFSELEAGLEIGELVRGRPGEFSVTLSAGGGGVDPSIDEVRAVVKLEDPLTGRADTVELEGRSADDLTGVFDVPADLRSAALRVSASVEVISRTGGRTLVDSDDLMVSVRRPGEAVQFEPAVLRWPTLDRDKTVRATLRATAGAVDGCVWFDAARITGPAEAGAIEVTHDGRAVVSEDDCIEVPAGSDVEIDVVLRTEAPSSGSVRGHLVVHERADGAATVTDLSISGRLHRGVDQVRRIALVAGLSLAGLLLPIGLLVLVNTVGARFQRLDAVRGASLPVRVRGDRIDLLGDGRSRRFVLLPEFFESLAGHGSSRDFTFGGIRFRARPSRNPFGPTRAMAAPEGGAERLRGRVGRKVELDAGLAGSWVFLLDPDLTRATERGTAVGRLIAFAHETADDASLQRLGHDIARRLPGTAAALGDAVWDKTIGTRKADEAER